MSSRKKHDIGIKWVEYLTGEEALGSKELKSVISLCNGTSLTCKFNDHKGGIGSHNFIGIFYANGFDYIDPFCDGYLIPVRIHYRNGCVGYGFKYWGVKTVVKRMNGKLRSYFIKDGYIDDATGELKYEISSDSVIPCNILRMIPFYNEKVRDDNNKMDDYNVNYNISSILSSNTFCTYETEYSVPPNSKNDVKMPWVQVDISNMRNDKDNYPSSYSSCNGSCVKETKDESLIIKRTYCYSYFKSMYVDDMKLEYVYGIIPMSDLYVINRKVGYVSEEEVWNNIDNTITGNI